VLRAGDSDAPSASKIHYMMFEAQEELASLVFPFLTAVDAKATLKTVQDIHYAK
jgi:hypothetical protein